MPLYKFTVFTPVYNRKEKLHRVYESLLQQSFRDFEWLIIDDGSTEDIRSLVETWQQEANFPIRYVWQENGHKKTAFNHGVRLAEGELFIPADSDDRFTPDALQCFSQEWQSIPENERDKFSGICCLCQDEQGQVVGDKFPGGWGIDSDELEMRYRFGVSGEKWGCDRTDILREHPFPDQLSGHVPEGVLWLTLAAKYKKRFINKALRIYYQDHDNRLARTFDPVGNAAGNLYRANIVLSNQLRWFWHKPLRFILQAACWTRFRLHLHRKMNINFWPASVMGIFLIFLTAPLGVIWWLRDRWRMQKSCAA